MSNITVLGDGGWGTAIALCELKNGHDVTLWGPFPENLQAIRMNHENKFLKGVAIPETLQLEADIQNAVEKASILVLASPSQFMRGTLETLKPFFKPEKQIIVNVAKGIENKTLLRMDELTEQVLGPSKYAALSGPSHAEEVSRSVPTAVVAASKDPAVAEKVQQEFMAPLFRIYTTTDLVSVELGGALKNVLAIAAGIIDGMGLGDNTKAALMTRGIAEMARLGEALGGNRETFSGLSGIGDLIVTCMSRHSRNRHVGEELGRGKTLEQINAEMGMVVAEGVRTSISALQLARRTSVDTPLIDTVHAVLFDNLSPRDAVIGLMTRSAKKENE